MIGMFGAACVLGIAAIGSAIGIGCAGQAAIGAWKRCYMNNKPAPFILTVFAGAPLTQTIYGFLLMQNMINSTKDGLFLLALGIFSGLAMAASAVFQGKAQLCCCRNSICQLSTLSLCVVIRYIRRRTSRWCSCCGRNRHHG